MIFIFRRKGLILIQTNPVKYIYVIITCLQYVNREKYINREFSFFIVIAHFDIEFQIPVLNNEHNVIQCCSLENMILFCGI